MPLSPHPSTWLYPTPQGLWCEPGRFFIDPVRPVERAVITHGHGDHARPGHQAVLATPETLEIMKVRLGEGAGGTLDPSPYGETRTVGDVEVSLHPAGHILGSAQVKIVHRGACAVVSGDYKRAADPTCAPFELQRCNLFITEATFALPVFRHAVAGDEARRLVASIAANPDRAHLLGVYGLGKCQRMIALVRAAGYDRPIFLHGALEALCALYERHGIALGPLEMVGQRKPEEFAGELVLCPPGDLGSRWTRRLGDPLTAFASGWMRVRGRARQRGVELPLVVSDHADWPELLVTIAETGAEEVWVTHGREDALIHELGKSGLKARALSLVGFEDEGD
ncbi:MAG: ligase-associated DNA damage response exonuclease [Hyphomicrobiales bacterium]